MRVFFLIWFQGLGYGISGVVTRPVRGAKERGFGGFVEGCTICETSRVLGNKRLKILQRRAYISDIAFDRLVTEKLNHVSAETAG
jgi:hypothetical protein